MGLESREYYRDGRYTTTLTGLGLDFTPVVKYLIIANAIVFLLQIFITRAPDVPARDQDFWAKLEEDVPQAPPGKDDGKDPDARKKREEDIRKAHEMMEEMMSRMPGMRVSLVQEWFELDPKKTVEGFQLWRLVTCAFCHQRLGIWHIVFNMLMLYWFGTRLERMYGAREFLLFYLAAAVTSSLAYLGLAYYTGSYVPAIGASGAVMGVVMVYVIYYPTETILLCWFIPVPLWLMLAIYVLFDLHPVLLALAGDRLFTGVAHAGHLGGLAFGFLYWWSGIRLERIFDRTLEKRPRLRVKAPPRTRSSDRQPDELATRVDEILAKISRQGKESLTAEEREVLSRASAKYRGQA